MKYIIIVLLFLTSCSSSKMSFDKTYEGKSFGFYDGEVVVLKDMPNRQRYETIGSITIKKNIIPIYSDRAIINDFKNEAARQGGNAVVLHDAVLEYGEHGTSLKLNWYNHSVYTPYDESKVTTATVIKILPSLVDEQVLREDVHLRKLRSGLGD